MPNDDERLTDLLRLKRAIDESGDDGTLSKEVARQVAEQARDARPRRR
jgi:hypothetical protein